MKRSEIAIAAQTLVNTPFRRGGRQPGLRLDCPGVLVCVAQAVHYPIEDTPGTDYTLRDADHKLIPALRKWFAEQPKEVRNIGDILALRFSKPGPQHVVLVTRVGWILHAHIPSRAVVETPLPTDWLPRITHSFRFHGVED